MTELLPVRTNVEQLRHQAKDLLGAAKAGDAEALARNAAVSDRLTLSSAQLALAPSRGASYAARSSRSLRVVFRLRTVSVL